jgi:hypothetical protein
MMVRRAGSRGQQATTSQAAPGVPLLSSRICLRQGRRTSRSWICRDRLRKRSVAARWGMRKWRFPASCRCENRRSRQSSRSSRRRPARFQTPARSAGASQPKTSRSPSTPPTEQRRAGKRPRSEWPQRARRARVGAVSRTLHDTRFQFLAFGSAALAASFVGCVTTGTNASSSPLAGRVWAGRGLTCVATKTHPCPPSLGSTASDHAGRCDLIAWAVNGATWSQARDVSRQADRSSRRAPGLHRHDRRFPAHHQIAPRTVTFENYCT